MAWDNDLGDFLNGAGGLVSPAGWVAGNAGDINNWLTGRKGEGQIKSDRNMVGGYLTQGNPFLPQDTMDMLRKRAMGLGPSIAGDAYNTASQNALAQQLALSRGAGSAGAGRQAAMNMGNISQGQAQGYSNARDQEMQGYTNQLVGAQQGNQSAWMQMLAAALGLDKSMLGQTGMEQLGNIGSLIQGGANAAKIAGGGGGH
jgi:hypothetical protein